MDVNTCSRSKMTPKTVGSESPATYKLSEEQLRSYHDNGFLVIERLIDPADLKASRDHFIRICNGLVSTHQFTIVRDKTLTSKSDKPEDYINKLNDIQYEKVFMTYTEHPTLLGVLAQLLGEDILVISAMFINKPPGTAQHHPHQDLHFSPFRPADKIVGAWTALDAATVDNGCMWVVPKSHKIGKIYPHVSLPGALKQYFGVSDDTVAAPHKRVYLEMSPGDTLLFHPLLLHGSGPNITKDYRKCITAHYASSDCEVVDARGGQQEALAREIEADALRRGLDMSFTEIWRYKSKVVRGKPKL